MATKHQREDRELRLARKRRAYAKAKVDRRCLNCGCRTRRDRTRCDGCRLLMARAAKSYRLRQQRRQLEG